MFLKGSLVVGAVGEDNIDVVELETLEAGLAAFNNVLPRAAVHVWLRGVVEEKFGRHDVVLARNVERLESNAHLDFCGAACVAFCSVEEVDSSVPALLHRFSAQFLGFFSVLVVGKTVTVG